MQVIRLLKILCSRSKATAYGLSPAGVYRNVQSLTIVSGKVRSEVEGPMWPFYARVEIILYTANLIQTAES